MAENWTNPASSSAPAAPAIRDCFILAHPSPPAAKSGWRAQPGPFSPGCERTGSGGARCASIAARLRQHAPTARSTTLAYISLVRRERRLRTEMMATTIADIAFMTFLPPVALAPAADRDGGSVAGLNAHVGMPAGTSISTRSRFVPGLQEIVDHSRQLDRSW
jgi:hypothetical protein